MASLLVLMPTVVAWGCQSTRSAFTEKASPSASVVSNTSPPVLIAGFGKVLGRGDLLCRQKLKDKIRLGQLLTDNQLSLEQKRAYQKEFDLVYQPLVEQLSTCDWRMSGLGSLNPSPEERAFLAAAKTEYEAQRETNRQQLAVDITTAKQAMPKLSRSAQLLRDRRSGAMQALPGGTFLYGDSNEKWSLEPFAMDVTEVTVEAYQACVKDQACDPAGVQESECNWDRRGRERHPINCVDWNQAHAFCAWAGKRLPTEQEWEYAARSSDGRSYPWVKQSPFSTAAAPKRRLCWQEQGTCPVGAYPLDRSAYGIVDLSGNVSEWTASKRGEMRVERGGNWSSSSTGEVDVYYRDWDIPEIRGSRLGLRCAR